jgi:hypothetical protein
MARQSLYLGLRWLTALIQKLWDIAWDMDNRNRMLHEQENLPARPTEIDNRLYEFIGVQPVSPRCEALFSRGLQTLLRQQPAYQTACTIRIQAVRARAERRNGPRQAQQRNTFNQERPGNATVARYNQQLRLLKKKRKEKRQ